MTTAVFTSIIITNVILLLWLVIIYIHNYALLNKLH